MMMTDLRLFTNAAAEEGSWSMSQDPLPGRVSPYFPPRYQCSLKVPGEP
jgi:hypothetical protein